MPSTLLLYQRDAEASASSQTKSAPVPLNKAEIALVAVFSALIFGIMVFCVFRFCPGMCGRQRRKNDGDQPSAEVKQTFLDLDDDKTMAEKHAPRTEVVQTFLHLDEDKSLSEKKGLGIDGHPALRGWTGRSKQKHSQNRGESLDSSSSISPLIKRSETFPTSPPLAYSPRNYSPRTPPSVPENNAEVRVLSKPIRPLPTPVQPMRRSPDHLSRYDISPIQSSSTVPSRSQLPMSFIMEIDAKREDQTGGRRTVSPLQNSPTPHPDRYQSESQLSSRNVSPISAASSTPVITYPSVTPVYLPRPFSKYNPYRPALEPATSKNWPLENIAIPEHQAITIPSTAPPIGLEPIHKQLTESSIKPSGTPSPIPERSPSQATTAVASIAPEKPSFSHPELDQVFLEDFHRRRRQHQKAKEEAQKQKRKAEREQREQRDKNRKQKQDQQTSSSATAAASIFRPAKKLPHSKEQKGIPPNPPPSQDREAGSGTPRSRPLINPESTSTGARSKGTSTADRRKSLERKTMQKSMLISTDNPNLAPPIANSSKSRTPKSKQPRLAGLPRLPPRLPSKSRKPSQSPDAYEKARWIGGLHELVGSENSSASSSKAPSPVPSPEGAEAAAAKAMAVTAAVAMVGVDPVDGCGDCP